MSSQDVPNGLPISEADWKQTPPSVRAFILSQQELITKLTKRVEELEARLGQNSNNSNRPPSSDSPYQKEKRESKGTGKPGARRGHKGHQQALLPPTQVEPVPPPNLRLRESQIRDAETVLYSSTYRASRD